MIRKLFDSKVAVLHQIFAMNTIGTVYKLVDRFMVMTLTTNIPAKALRFFNKSNSVLATKAMSWKTE